MVRQFSILLLIFFPSICLSQQAKIGFINDNSGIGSSFTYHSKFLIDHNGPVFFNYKTEFYHSKKVKQVEIVSEHGTLLWRLKLDTAGTILSIGKPNKGYFVEYEENKPSNKAWNEITRYYNDYSQTELLRVDTVKHITREYTNGDTIIGYSLTDHLTYKKGALINDQNRYYNSKYLNKKIDSNVNYMYPSYDFLGLDSDNERPIVYYKNPYKTDYDSLELYFSFSERRRENVFGYLKSGRNGFEIENSKHPFLQGQDSFNFRNCITEGESFNEPVFTIYQTLSIDDTDYEYNNGYEKGYNTHENGLIKEHYTDFYPIDTAATSKAKKDALTQKTSNNLATSNERIYYQNVIRQKEPIRRETYSYSYVYYE